MAEPAILIVDDHDGFRTTLREWLAATLPTVVTYEAASAEEGLAVARELVPRVVLMDIGLPGISGIEATRRLVGELPGTSVIMVSIHETAVHRAAAAAAGAVGYVAKSGLAAKLAPLLKQLLACETGSAR